MTGPLRDEVTAVLAEHAYRPSLARGVERCGCGESRVGEPGWHRAHQADALLPLLASVRDDARAAVAFNAAHPDFQRFLHRVTKRAHDDGLAEGEARVRARVEAVLVRDTRTLDDIDEPAVTFDDLRAALAELPSGDDPTHGRIEADIRQNVDGMSPTSLGQRVAIENTLQDRRDRGGDDRG